MSILANPQSGLGTPKDPSQQTRILDSLPLAEGECEALYEDAILGRIVDAFPDDASQEGWEVQTGSGDNPILQDHLTEYVSKIRLRKHLTSATKQARCYGGAALVILAEDGRPADQPINRKNLKSIRGFTVLDRYSIQPRNDYAYYIEPEEVLHYELADYDARLIETIFKKQINLRYIHRDRIIRLDGKRGMPRKMWRTNQGWGNSVYQGLVDEFTGYKTGTMSVSTMILNCSFLIRKIKDLYKLTRANDPDELQKVLQNQNIAKSIFGHNVIDLEETLEFLDRQFSGLGEAMDKLREAFIGASNIPHDRLFGESPSGLGATGESERWNWAQTVASFQTNHWKEPLEYLYRLIFLAKDGPTEGVLPEKVEISFPSIFQQSLTEQMQAEQSKVTILGYWQQMGVITNLELRNILKDSAFGKYLDEQSYQQNQQQQRGYGGYYGY